MSLKDTYACAWESIPVTIAANGSLSGAINLGGLRLFAVVAPANWSSSKITLQMSPDGGSTWVDVYDANGNEVFGTAEPSRCIAFDPKYFSSIQYLRLRSGTSATPVAQTGTDRTLQLIVRTV